MLYVNNIPQALTKSRAIFFQSKYLNEMENQLKKEIARIDDCFTEKKLPIHFGECKKNCTFFCRIKALLNPNKLQGKEN